MSSRSLVVSIALAGSAAGCPYVADGEIRILSGPEAIGPGAVVTYALYCDRLFAGWEIAAGGHACEGAWQLSDPRCVGDCPMAGGPELGTLSACGVYTAPTVRPPVVPMVAATECSAFDCADACGAGRELVLDGYDLAPLP